MSTKNVGGRPRKLNPSHAELLREVAREQPMATLEELRQAFARRSGVEVSGPTLLKGLKQAGIVRVRPEGRRGDAAPRPAEAPKAKRYGYTEAHREPGDHERYPTCLTEAEWALAADLFEPAGRGLPPRYPRRRMVDACCYVLRTGCAWRQLPKDFPPWQAVYKAFSRWAARGLFERFHDRCRGQWRQRVKRETAPTAAVIDAQSTRHSPQGGEAGFDAGKKVKGRKRNLVVDTLGLLLAVVVTAASVQDRDAALPAMAVACGKYPSLRKVYVDGAYAGQCAQALHSAHGLEVEVVRHPGNRNVGRWHPAQLALFEPEPRPGFLPLPKRWVVERTHAWNERARRLIMHHDRKIEISTAWVWFAEARLLVRRLTTV